MRRVTAEEPSRDARAVSRTLLSHGYPCHHQAAAPPGPDPTRREGAAAADLMATRAGRSTSRCAAACIASCSTKLNLEKLATAERSRVEAEIRALVSTLIAETGMPLSVSERDAILGDVIDEVFGFGPLEPLLRDKTVSDILVNTYKQVFVERAGKLESVPAAFQDDQHLLRVIDRIVSGVGRRIDDSSPMVDARLPDGSRVNAIIAPLAVDGPLLSIRRFPAERLQADDLVGVQGARAEHARVPAPLRRARS